MKFNRQWIAVTLLASTGLSHCAFAACAFTEEALKLDPVEVGFCESDAVFVGKVEGATETIGGVTEEGSTNTKHFDVQRSSLHVLDRYKGKLPDKVTMVADLYSKDGAYVFESGKTYLVFAKRLVGENEYAGATAACALQATLLIGEADNVLKQLEQQKKGSKKIDCKKIRAKENM
jgi:hypothetical protein